jgi:hypothetical protein
MPGLDYLWYAIETDRSWSQNLLPQFFDYCVSDNNTDRLGITP